MLKFTNLKEWFQLLVRNKMQGPALTTAGTGIGLAIMAAGLFPWGQPTQEIMLIIGLGQIAASAALFVCFAALHLYKSL